MAKKDNRATKKQKIAVLARQDDGTIQLTFTIPWKSIEVRKEEALQELAKTLEIAGFRKGKVPPEIAKKHLSEQDIYNQVLQKILPDIYASAIEQYQLRPVLAPRIQLISANQGSDWLIRAETCELPKVKLGDYKKIISGAVSAGNIWTPGKDLNGQPKPRKNESTVEEKQQSIIRAIIDNFDIKIPKLLIDEEVNHKLSRLLEQTQKLGLTIEQYLASSGKTIDQIKEEYRKQAEEAIKLELVLNAIADAEKIEVPSKEIEQVMNLSQAPQGQKDGKTSKETRAYKQHREVIRSVLMRRRALDRLVSLV